MRGSRWDGPLQSGPYQRSLEDEAVPLGQLHSGSTTPAAESSFESLGPSQVPRDGQARSAMSPLWSLFQEQMNTLCRQHDASNFLIQLGTIVVHTVAMALTVKGTLLSFEAALFVWPMLTVATVHHFVLRSRLYLYHPTATITALEALYFTVAVSSMPMWFLQQPVTTALALARAILLGTTSCLVGWNMWMFPKPLLMGCIVPAVQIATGALLLNQPVCSCIHSHPYGASLMEALHQGIDRAAAEVLPIGRHPYNCHSVLLLVEVTTLAILLYWKYRVHYASWQAFLHAHEEDEACSPNLWPHAPLLVVLVLHLLIGVIGLGAIWQLLHAPVT